MWGSRNFWYFENFFAKEAWAKPLQKGEWHAPVSNLRSSRIATATAKQSATVLSGQQVGLLGGPAFVAAKIFGVLKKAKELQHRAVFWLETNDSDFSEANTLYFMSSGGKAEKLVWKKKSYGRPIGHLEIDAEARALVLHFFTSLPRQTSRVQATKKFCLEALALGRPLGLAVEELLTKLYAGYGIEIFNPQNKAFIEFSRPYLWQAAASTALGQQAPIFALIKGRREAVFREKNGLFVTRNKAKVDIDKALLLPSLRTRSVVQDAYFKASFYIAGKSESAYLKTLKPEYSLLGVRPAVVLERMSFSVLPSQLAGKMEAANFSLAQSIDLSAEDLRRNLLKRGGFQKKQIEAVLRSLKKELLKTYEKALLGASFETAKNKQKTRHEFQREFGKTMRLKERVLHKQMLHLRGNLRLATTLSLQNELRVLQEATDYLQPFGGKQERQLNAVFFFAQYGNAFLEALAKNYQFAKEEIIIL